MVLVVSQTAPIPTQNSVGKAQIKSESLAKVQLPCEKNSS